MPCSCEDSTSLMALWNRCSTDSLLTAATVATNASAAVTSNSRRSRADTIATTGSTAKLTSSVRYPARPSTKNSTLMAASTATTSHATQSRRLVASGFTASVSRSRQASASAAMTNTDIITFWVM